MGLAIEWKVESLGLEFDAAYARLHRYGRQSSVDPQTERVGLAGLVCEFLVYANQATREAKCNAIGSISFVLPSESVDWSTDLAAQAYAELKKRHPDGVDA